MNKAEFIIMLEQFNVFNRLPPKKQIELKNTPPALRTEKIDLLSTAEETLISLQEGFARRLGETVGRFKKSARIILEDQQSDQQGENILSGI